ncbi:hypothetical protein PanWU01x14_038990, partial [Parasponia andersonii]
VFIYPGCPMPPIATNWYKHHYPHVDGWKTPYVARIKVFHDLVGNDIATQETIDLDSL